MKFTLSWLKDHLDTQADLAQIVEALNEVGLEVEEIKNQAQALAGFSVARIKEARKHPDADRLRVCDVETEDGVVQVVCGAPNARTGLVGIFAPAGTHIPGTGIDLKTGIIRGVESAGMMCSERELMVSDEHDGIIDLSGDLPVGMAAAQALGLDDPMLDIDVTTNRPDALGVRGIARDLAAYGLGALKPLSAEPVRGTYASPVDVRLSFADGDDTPCPVFVGRHFKGIKNGRSPDWLQRRLQAIGLRPISALVDITNYITFSYGRPLHVFDAAKLRGTVQARMAQAGEEITALDGNTYKLDETMTVISDDAGAQAIGGIIGGEATGCSASTTEVFLECAYFDPIRTAVTGRKLNVLSDARFRFERGIDPQFIATGVELATALVLEICGGQVSEIVRAGEEPDHQRSFTLRNGRVKSLGGIDVPADRQEEILTALGFLVKQTKAGLKCRVPSWRPDIHGEADLVEEVIRIAGINKIEPAPMPRPHAVARPVLNVLQKRMQKVRRLLAARGMHEAVTWAFLAEREAKLFGGGQDEVKLANPMSIALSDMRPSLLPNLIAAAGRNLARGYDSPCLFEVGHAYAGDQPSDETLRACGVRQGNASARSWTGAERLVDVFDVKADAMDLLAIAGAPVANLQVTSQAPAWYHPGRSGTIQLGPKNQMGWFGEIHPLVLAKMDVKGPVVAFEIVLDNIPSGREKSAARAPMQTLDLMSVRRDFAFVVDEDVPAEKVVRAARSADKAVIRGITVFDVYSNMAPDIYGPNKKSVAIEITIQPVDKTLTDKEIENIGLKVTSQVQKATGGILRS